MSSRNSDSGRRRVSVGLDLPNPITDLHNQMDDAAGHGFDFLCSYVIHNEYKSHKGDAEGTIMDTFTHRDPVLNNGKWAQCIVGKPDLSHLKEEFGRSEAETKGVLERMISFCSHFNIPAVQIPCPTHLDFGFSRMMYYLAHEYPAVQIWMHVKVSNDNIEQAETLQRNTYSDAVIGGGQAAQQHSTNRWMHSVGYTLTSPGAVDTQQEGIKSCRATKLTWDTWNQLRMACEHHPNLNLCLELGKELPEEREVEKWIGEPVKAAILPTGIFLTNKQGYPTLTKRHQNFVRSLYNLGIQFIIRPKHGEQVELRHYLQYIAHAISKLPPKTDKDEFEEPYYDVLQSPLQPLKDHLDSSTYEVFETDPVKYSQYQQALDKALADTPADSEVVVMVVGAGRGPLVRCSLQAGQNSNRKVKVYAVEKNPNAVITLRNLRRLEGWGNKVEIVETDMRNWNAPEQADVIVSELLGSFGDNELSPECLDGAQRHLKSTGISIPTAYTSYVAPVLSSKLWNEVYTIGHERKHFETPYVCKLYNHFQIAHPEPCFTFVHPSGNHPSNPWTLLSCSAEVSNSQCVDHTNRRGTACRFVSDCNAAVHGFAGYFDAQLYKDVYLSIHPTTHSPEMFSWFPIFIPIRHPFTVSRGDCIAFHISRELSGKAVWYEWAVAKNEEFVCSLHNPGGRSYSIAL
eukprot:gb/GECG01002671.1/.p1 GENE.gb/GECG01002671.1/~~gb/GECG01002671.1/.p1  ORF type:complete len:685 (+),score=75.98 gb/GECG01002671.1/:1-2055(+)